MERLRSALFIRFVAVTLATALLLAAAGSLNANRAADHMVDRVSWSFSGDEAVMTAATAAAAESPASFDEFLIAFIGELEETSGSAGEILIGQSMSQSRLLDLLRERFSDELAPAVSPRQILSVASAASTTSRDRITQSAAVKKESRTPLEAVPAVADAAVTARLVSCGFRCSAVQPLGP